METDYVKALETANWYYDLNRRHMKFDKPTAVRELDQYGLFSPVELSHILDTTVETVKKARGMQPVETWPQRVWKLDALHVLWLLAVEWRDSGAAEDKLIQRASDNGTSMKAISQLTGIPLDKVREAVYGGPSMLGLLRSGVDPTSD